MATRRASLVQKSTLSNRNISAVYKSLLRSILIGHVTEQHSFCTLSWVFSWGWYIKLDGCKEVELEAYVGGVLKEDNNNMGGIKFYSLEMIYTRMWNGNGILFNLKNK